MRLSEIFRHLMQLTDTNQTEFAKIAEVEPSYISMILSGKNKNIGKSTARRIATKLGISEEWIMTGKGEKPITLDIREKLDNDEFIEVEVLTMAGVGLALDEENNIPMERIEFSKDSVTRDGKVINRAVRASGDSMYPTIYNHAIVGIDWDDKEIIDNGLYLIRFPNLGISIKRLQLRSDGVLVMSDNKQVEPEKIPLDIVVDGFILGRVRWVYNQV